MTEALEQEDTVRMSELGSDRDHCSSRQKVSFSSEPDKWIFPFNKNRTSRVQTGGEDGPALMAASPNGSFTTDPGQLCAAAVTVRLLEVRADYDEE
jgi:hypothetical protein